jgi:hypothetical protein
MEEMSRGRGVREGIISLFLCLGLFDRNLEMLVT